MIDPALHQLFSGAVLNGATKFIAIPVRWGRIGVQIGWIDATSAATITLEMTSTQAAFDVAGAAWEWGPSGVAVTGPTGVAAGTSFINIESCRQQRARLKIVATANCNFIVTDGTAGTEMRGMP